MAKWQRSFYQPNLPLGTNGERLTACKKHIELSKNAAKEGMVLLKNEQQLLPLATGTKLALFGKGSFDYVKGGGGSGDVTVSYITNLYDGLKGLSEPVQIFEEGADFYRENIKQQYKEKREPGMTKEPELSAELCKKARERVHRRTWVGGLPLMHCFAFIMSGDHLPSMEIPGAIS